MPSLFCIALALPLTLAACSTEHAAPPRDLAILDQGAIAPVRVIGGRDIDYVGRVAGGAVLPDGGFLLADATQGCVLELDASGAILRRRELRDLIQSGSVYPGPVIRLDDGTFWMMGGSRLVHFSTELDTLGTLPGESRPGSGLSLSPGGLARGRGNTFWATDIEKSRVLHLGADGQLLSSFGRYCADDCGFKYPTGIAEAADGSILVADVGLRRVRRFSPEGEYRGDIGTSADFGAPEWVGVTATGRIAVLDRQARQLLFYPADGQGAPIRSATLELEVYRPYDLPGSCIVASAGDVWIPGPSGLLRVSESGVIVGSFGRARLFEPGYFEGAHDIERDGRGHLFVAAADGRIQELDARGVYLRDMPRDDVAGENTDHRIVDMAVERNGTLNVLSYDLDNRLLRWRPDRIIPDSVDLVVISELGLTADEVSVHPDGDLLVLASAGYLGGRHLFRIDPNGVPRWQWIVPHVRLFSYLALTAFEVAPDGRIWAHGSFRSNPPYPFIAFNEAGQILEIWWLGTTGIGTIAQPHGLQFDAQGHLLILSGESSVLFRYRTDGQLMNRWRLLADDGRVLGFPLDAALTHDGRITVASYGGSSVFEYDIGVE